MARGERSVRHVTSEFQRAATYEIIAGGVFQIPPQVFSESVEMLVLVCLCLGRQGNSVLHQ